MSRKQLDVQCELEDIMKYERAWKNHLSKQDSGSYCENASQEHHRALTVLKAYRMLTDLLLDYERGV